MEPLRIPFSHSTGQESPIDVVNLADLRGRELDHSVYQPTRLSFYLLQFVFRGEGAHWVDFERVNLRAGDVLHIRADQAHAFDSGAKHDASMLMFTADCLAQLPGLYPTRWPESQVLRPAARDFEVLHALVKAQGHLDQDGTHMRSHVVGPHLLAAVLTGLSEVVAEQFGGVDPKADRYAQLVESFEALLREHSVEERQLGSYVDRLGATARTLSRAVREVRGISPKELLDRYVMVEAKRRLGTTTRTVEAIGLELGFPEATNFVRFFKRLAGVPPDAFRRSLQPTASPGRAARAVPSAKRRGLPPTGAAEH